MSYQIRFEVNLDIPSPLYKLRLCILKINNHVYINLQSFRAKDKTVQLYLVNR